MKVRPFAFVNSRYSFNYVNPDQFDKRKNTRAAMPNLVHSLDACSIALLYKEFTSQGRTNLYTVHDCFAVTADKVGMLTYLLKSVYIKIYSEIDYLKSLDAHVRNTITNTFGVDVMSKDGRYIIIDDSELPYPKLDKIINTDPGIVGLSDSTYIIG